MENTRAGLYGLVRSIRSEKLISEKGAELFKEAIKTAELDDLPELEDMILEAAENMSSLLTDIQLIAETIYTTFRSYKRALKFGRELQNRFKVLKLDSIDVFEIYNVRSFRNIPEEDRHNRLIFHLIIKVDYEGTIYGFGFNPAHNTVSYTVGDQERPLFDKISDMPKQYEEIIRLLSYLVQYIMDIV